MKEKSNGQRKTEQRAAYHNMFKPHVKPRSRKWTMKNQDPKMGKMGK